MPDIVIHLTCRAFSLGDSKGYHIFICQMRGRLTGHFEPAKKIPDSCADTQKTLTVFRDGA